MKAKPKNELSLYPDPTATSVWVGSFTEWKKYGHNLVRLREATKWAFGDWIIRGEELFKDKAIQEAADILGIDPATMTTVVSVCKAFPPDRRHMALPFEHHRECYALIKEEAEAWLMKAEEDHWTKEELRTHMTQAGAKKKAPERKKKSKQTVPTTELYGELKEKIAFAMDAIPPLVEVCAAINEKWDVRMPSLEALDILDHSIIESIKYLDGLRETVLELLNVEEAAA